MVVIFSSPRHGKTGLKYTGKYSGVTETWEDMSVDFWLPAMGRVVVRDTHGSRHNEVLIKVPAEIPCILQHSIVLRDLRGALNSSPIMTRDGSLL